MEPKPIQLVGSIESRDSTLAKDAKVVNGYAEKTAGDVIVVKRRPGLLVGSLYEAGTVQGVVNYLGIARVFVNNKFFTSPTTSKAITAAAGEQIDCV